MWGEEASIEQRDENWKNGRQKTFLTFLRNVLMDSFLIDYQRVAYFLKVYSHSHLSRRACGASTWTGFIAST